MNNNIWISFPKEQPDAKLRLFCFPYAGSGASVYRLWPDIILSEVEICAIKLPGHESRFIEEPYRRITKLVEDLASEIFPLFNKPFLFFGHSIGAHISFQLARYLRRNCKSGPIHMFVSGSRAPHIPDNPDSLHYKMEDDIFIKKLIELGGMEEEILHNKELMDLILPILRADVEMLNTIKYIEEEPLECGISSFGGLFDPRVSREDCEAWNKHTYGNFSLTMIPGKHLFINSHREQLIDLVNKDISNCLKNGF
ncbi:MAG: thioesterase domain-containing protein [Desulfobacteraceae bacterium]|jgi:medium-chain acyl-[acyl-carrier-protein] hydrolase